jgi:hypothetical protein
MRDFTADYQRIMHVLNVPRCRTSWNDLTDRFNHECYCRRNRNAIVIWPVFLNEIDRASRDLDHSFQHDNANLSMTNISN